MPKPGSDQDKTKEQLIKELEQTREQVTLMNVLANTGTVNNLSYFQDRLAQEVSRSSRYKYVFSIVIVELDNFDTHVNKYGSAAGTELVGMLQTILRNALRIPDIYCHFENSKFGLLLPYTESDGADIIAGRIVQTTERVLALKSMSTNIPLTLSAGIAVFPRDAVSEKMLADLADDALRSARQRGGNRYSFAGAPEAGPQAAVNPAAEQAGKNEALLAFLEDEMQRSSRYSTELSLMLVSFSEPDRNGWLAALQDRRRTGPYFDSCILGCIRGMDRPFTYNTGQLAVLLPNTSTAGALVLAKKMLDSFTGPAGPVAEGKEPGLSLNVGIAVFPIDEVSRDGLISCAEASLNMALRRGSNQVVPASSLARPEGGIQRDVTAWIESVREMGQSSIYNLLAVVDATERYIVPHSQNTTRLSIALGQVLGLHAANSRKLRVMSLLHDLGKIYLAPEVIAKPGPLDDKELAIMRKHPEFGATVVQQFPDFAFCSRAILAHHERMDGRGYPAGLKGEQIPLESRIIAVAEAFDDMVTPRPYRENLSLKEALKELTRNAGSQFDLEVVNAMKKVISSASRR